MQEGLLANGGDASASTPGAPTSSSPNSMACGSASQNMDTFLVSWRANIRPKFVPLLSALSRAPAACNLLLCQVGRLHHQPQEAWPVLCAIMWLTCSYLFL